MKTTPPPTGCTKREVKRAIVAALCATALMAAGCDDSPTSPTSGPISNGANTTLDGIRGQVRDTLGRPVDDARVEVADGPLAGRHAVTGADGRFLFSAALTSVDVATLHVTKAGFSPASLRWAGRNDFFITLLALNALDLAGRYDITFTAASSCSQLPPPVRSRTFTGLMSRGEDNFIAFTTQLSGPDLFPAYDRFWASVGHDAARFSVYSLDAFKWWLEDQPIIERVGANGFLSFIGTAHAPVMTPPAAFTAAFDGSISFCSMMTPPARDSFPPTCAAPVECRSDRHQIRFTRR
jgi:hypothetical protein